MYRALILGLLLGCGARLDRPKVHYGASEPLPLVQTSSDTRRWYVPLDAGEAGQQVWFIDTGYRFTTCDDQLVASLGLRPRGGSIVRGELGRLVVRNARLPPLQIGGHRVDALVCQVRDLGTTSSIPDPREVPVAGVLGMDVLRGFVVTLDPERGVMELHPPDHAAPEGAQVLELRRERGGHRVRIPLVVDRRRVWPLVDTGAAETFLDGERLGLKGGWERAGMRVRGTGGGGSTVRTLRYFRAEVRLGEEDLGVLTITGRPRAEGRPGLVGLDILGQFRQVYDFPGGVAYFTRVQPTELPSWRRWKYGREEGLDGTRLLRGPVEGIGGGR